MQHNFVSALLLVALALMSCSDRQTPSAPENYIGANQLTEMQTRAEAFREKTKNLTAELRAYADKAGSRLAKLDYSQTSFGNTLAVE